jgi:hypothetical protein
LGFREVYDYVPGKAAWLAMALPFEGDSDPETRAGVVARRDTPTCTPEEDGEVKPGPSTFRPSVPREELAGYMDEHDLQRSLITTLDGRLMGAVYREDL